MTMKIIGTTLAATALVLGGTSTASAQAPAAATCTAADLSIAVGSTDAAAGTVHREILLTNRGTGTCVLRGFPGVSYVNSDGQQIGRAARRVGDRGPLVTLTRGATAVSDVGFASAGNFDPEACDMTPVWGIKVYPPDASDPLYLGLLGQHGCAGDVDQLAVATVQSWS
jgi:hypothetical protein